MSSNFETDIDQEEEEEEMTHQPAAGPATAAAACPAEALLLPSMIQAFRLLMATLSDQQFESEVTIERSRRRHAQKATNKGPSITTTAAVPQARNIPIQKRAPPLLDSSVNNNNNPGTSSRKRKKNCVVDHAEDNSLPSIVCADGIGGTCNAWSAAGGGGAAVAPPQRSHLEPTFHVPKDDSTMTQHAHTSSITAAPAPHKKMHNNNNNNNAITLGNKKQKSSLSTSKRATLLPYYIGADARKYIAPTSFWKTTPKEQMSSLTSTSNRVTLLQPPVDAVTRKHVPSLSFWKTTTPIAASDTTPFLPFTSRQQGVVPNVKKCLLMAAGHQQAIGSQLKSSRQLQSLDLVSTLTATAAQRTPGTNTAQSKRKKTAKKIRVYKGMTPAQINILTVVEI